MAHKKKPFVLWKIGDREDSEFYNKNKYEDLEPATMGLRKYGNDRAMKAREMVCCCDCGLSHTMIYEVFQGQKGHFWISVRAIRDDACTDDNRKYRRKEYPILRKPAKRLKRK
jgi:hypothetical protein